MLEFRPEKKAKQIIDFIRKICREEKYKNILIAVSGGIDSATSLQLCLHALGAQHVFPVLLPYGKLNDEGTKDSMLVIKRAGIPRKNITTVDIQPFVDAITKYDKKMEQINRGNIMARVRMI